VSYVAPLAVSTEPDGKQRMSMMMWMATEGGRRCPQCGKFAKADDLGNLSFVLDNGGRVTMFGHKPGKGCNRG
jgi:predicted nucleic acid-binding Zn ribbon protein